MENSKNHMGSLREARKSKLDGQLVKPQHLDQSKECNVAQFLTDSRNSLNSQTSK